MAYVRRCERAGTAGVEGASVKSERAQALDISPQQVQEKQFDRVKRGFDPQQVGMFLDQVAAAIAGRDRQLHEARTEIDALGREVTDAKQHEEAFRLTMMAASEAKEEMLRKAAEQAQQIETEARSAAELLVERARVDAEDQSLALQREIESLNAEKKRLNLRLPTSGPRRRPSTIPSTSSRRTAKHQLARRWS